MEGRILFRTALILAVAAQVMSAPQTTIIKEHPAHDAYVRASTPTTNYGGVSALRVRKSGSEELNTYLKFDISGLSGFVQSATLRLYVTDASPDGGSVYSVSNTYSGSTSQWTQSGLKWNNAPSITGTVLSSAGAVSVGQWVNFNVTSTVTGNGTYSFAVKNNSSNAAYYSAKEASNKPELVIATEQGPPLPPTLTLTTPNGDESWTIASTRTIRWNSTGTIANVALEFSADGGANWTPVITSTLNDGAYDWMIPDAESNQCVVRVSDATDGDPQDMSNTIFAIVTPPLATVALTSPNGGENLSAGSSHNITWSSTGSLGNVKLEYSLDNGGSWTVITSSTSNDGGHNWSVPNSPTSQALVRISDAADNDPQDVSNTVFAIVTAQTKQYALRFDGVDDFVAISDNALLSGGPGKSLTLEVWVKLESVSGHHPIVTKYLDNTWKDWGIEVDAGRIVVDIENNGDNWAYIIGTVSPGVWTHLAFAFNNAANILRIYKNGVEVGSGATLTKEMPDTRASLTFGRHYGNLVMPGTIDEVRVWNYARSASQITATMNRELVGNETGLIGYWSFNEGSGQAVGDVTGKGSKGRLGNSTSSDGADPAWVISTVPLGSSASALTLAIPNNDESSLQESDHEKTWTLEDSIAIAKLEYNDNFEFTEGGAAPPDEFRLGANYPNPFNPETRIEYDLPEMARVRLSIYNVLGQTVRTIVNQETPAGYHIVLWDGRDSEGKRVSAGVYFYQLVAGEFVATRKMLFLP